MTPRTRKAGWREGEFHCSRVRYWGDQDGPREQELKIELISYFKTRVEIQAAYFAKLGYNDDPPSTVALCLRALYNPNIAPLNTRIGEIYAPLFRGGGTMEIIYLSEKSERIVQQVCQPFYERYPMLPHERERLTTTAVVCSHVASKRHRMLHAARVKPISKTDSGWRCYCQSGIPEDHKDDKTITLRELLILEPDFKSIFDSPPDTFLWRPSSRMKWEHVKAANGNGKNGSNGHGPNGNGLNGHYSNGQNGHLGNGHSFPNGELNFVRETGRPFDRGITPAEPAETKPTDDDPIREDLHLRAGWPHPVEIALYYECLGCGEILSSASAGEAKCRCGNIAIRSGVITIKDVSKASAFRQR